jgi:hypothetical protein
MHTDLVLSPVRGCRSWLPTRSFHSSSSVSCFWLGQMRGHAVRSRRVPDLPYQYEAESGFSWCYGFPGYRAESRRP